MRYVKPTHISLFLMVASMILLVAFQAFWLRKEYNEQKSILQKETDILFRSAIQSLEDSVIQERIFQSGVLDKMPRLPVNESTKKSSKVPLQKVTLKTVESTANYKIPSASKVFFSGKVAKLQLADSIFFYQSNDTLKKKVIGLRDTAFGNRIQIVMINGSQNPDSLKLLAGRFTKKILQLQNSDYPNQERVTVTAHSPADCLLALTPKNTNSRIFIKSISSNHAFSEKKPLTDTRVNMKFDIKIEHDSLKIKDINRVYKRQIQKSKINLPFSVTRQLVNQPSQNSALTTSSVATTMPIGSTYAAIFPNYQGYLLKKIIPQGLFSFFLLAITGLAFGVIYRNLQQQRRLTDLKNDFISNVTHELKTPIATVSVAIEALQNFGVAQNPKLTEEYLEISKNELNRLTLLVDKVLKMTVFEQQGLNLNLESVNLADLVQQVLNSLKLQFEKYKAEVSFDKTGQGFIVSADKIHLTNVIYNLLDNALKYSENKPEIQVELIENDSEVKLSISDKGIGIPTEYQDKIFEKFFRVPTGNMHNVKGYGLGLNYVASVVKQHAGKIEVQSELNKGSMFTLTLQKAKISVV